MTTKYVSIDKVVAIQSYGAADTLLLHSLLDDHSEIISLPLLMAQGAYYVWEELCKKGITMENFILSLYSCLPEILNTPRVQSTPSINELWKTELSAVCQADVEAFLINLEAICPPIETLTRKEFLVSIFLAYNLSLNKRFTDKATLCLPFQSMPKKHAEWLIHDFKEVHFLHLMHEPVKNIAALMEKINYHPTPDSAKRGLLTCGFAEIALEKNTYTGKTKTCHTKTPYFPDYARDGKLISSRCVRQEDIKSSPEETMRLLGQWLNIGWEPSLLQPTVMGHGWSPKNEWLQAASKNTKAQPRRTGMGLLNAFDRYRLRLLTYSEQRSFGYGQLNWVDRPMLCLLPLLCLFPFKVAFNSHRFTSRRLYILTSPKKKKTPPGLRKNVNPNWTLWKFCKVAAFFLFRPPFNYLQLRFLFMKKWLLNFIHPNGANFVKKLSAQPILKGINQAGGALKGHKEAS